MESSTVTTTAERSNTLIAKYYPALNGYRAVAVLLVFSTHYLSSAIPGLRNWGSIGVDLFFVLSGFLITGILYDSRHTHKRYRNFYMRRALRIFPLYYGVLLLLALAYPFFRWRLEPGFLLWLGHLGNWARYLIFQPNVVLHLDILVATRRNILAGAVPLGHFWSLCVEEQFYLLWPVIVYTVQSRRRLLIISTLVVVLSPLMRLWFFNVLPAFLIESDILTRGTVFRLDSLLIGAILALLIRGPQAAWLEQYGRICTGVGVLALFILVANFRLRTHSMQLNLHDIVIASIGPTVEGLFSAAMILEVIRLESVVGKALTWKPLAALGIVSYGFYVFHDLPHMIYYHLALHLTHSERAVVWCTSAIGFFVTLALSFLSYRFYEKPFLSLKGKFTQ